MPTRFRGGVARSSMAGLEDLYALAARFPRGAAGGSLFALPGKHRAYDDFSSSPYCL